VREFRLKTHVVIAQRWDGDNLKDFTGMVPHGTKVEIQVDVLLLVLPEGRIITLLPSNWLVYRHIGDKDTWAVMTDKTLNDNYELAK